MSTEIISLDSSDDEESNSLINKPPKKKQKSAKLEIGECTLLPGRSPDKSKPELSPLLTKLLKGKQNSNNGLSDALLLRSRTAFVSHRTKSDKRQKVNGITPPPTSAHNAITLSDDEDVTEKKITPKKSVNEKSTSNATGEIVNNLKASVYSTEAIAIEDDDDSELPDISVRTSSSKNSVKKTSINNSQGCKIVCAMERVTAVEEIKIELPTSTADPLKIDEVEDSLEPQPSTSKENTESKQLFDNLLKLVLEKAKGSQFEQCLQDKMKVITKYYNRSPEHVNTEAFKTILINKIETLTQSQSGQAANTAILAFHAVYDYLKSHIQSSVITIEADDLTKVKKLERTMGLLVKRITQLEEAEIDFSDDEDSSYMQIDRFQKRLDQIYKKYCKYIRKNPHCGRATYDRITIVNSDYNEINQAISKKYSNSVVFPSYYEVEKLIRKVVEKKTLPLTEADIKIQSTNCFKNLGSILQNRRRQDLYDSHLAFIESSKDPASSDTTLENTLRKSYTEGNEKIRQLCEKYVQLQEKGEDKTDTSASDDDVGSGSDSEISSDDESSKANMDT